jgi:hypothetical protein
MANQTNTNPRRYDTAGVAICTDPTKILEMVWTGTKADGDDLVLTSIASGDTLVAREGKAGIDQFVINVPTVYPQLYLTTIGGGVLEVTVE